MALSVAGHMQPLSNEHGGHGVEIKLEDLATAQNTTQLLNLSNVVLGTKCGKERELFKYLNYKFQGFFFKLSTDIGRGKVHSERLVCL